MTHAVGFHSSHVWCSIYTIYVCVCRDYDMLERYTVSLTLHQVCTIKVRTIILWRRGKKSGSLHTWKIALIPCCFSRPSPSSHFAPLPPSPAWHNYPFKSFSYFFFVLSSWVLLHPLFSHRSPADVPYKIHVVVSP